jgi:leader peptidase (prepilin peptidase)/N-methyltransferase
VPPSLLPLLAAPFIGSFLGVLIQRLPAGEPVVAGRSRCPLCHHTLGPLELVPLLSHLAQRGRCRHCGGAIAPFHWQVELAALAVAASAALTTPEPAMLWANCLLGWTLLALAWIDLRTLLLPDALTLPLLLAGLAVTWALDPDALADHAAAALLAWAALALLATLYRRLRGRDGLGGGDAKLLAAGGAWLGLAALPWVIVLAAITTLLASLPRRGLARDTAVPFGPGLAMVIWLWRLFAGA